MDCMKADDMSMINAHTFSATPTPAEAVSRAIDPLLDEADPIEQSYYLEVGSRAWAAA